MTIRPFPFGFIYSGDDDVSEFSNDLSWDSVETPDEGQLWVSRENPISSYFGATFKSIWIGWATVLSDRGNTSGSIAELTVEKLEAGGWQEFHELMDNVVGRFVAFVWEGQNIRVYHDTTAIRPVYFNSTDSLVASHAPLLREVRQHLGRTVKPLVSLGQHKLWEETEDPDISALPANFYLDIQDKRIRRFYPHSPISTEFVPARERLRQAKYLAQKSMKFWGSLPLQVYCALTGGLDTRMNAAAALGTGLQIKYVTYGSRGEITDSDKATSRSYKSDFIRTSQISSALNLQHILLAVQDTVNHKLSDEERQILNRNTFGSHALQFQGLYESALGSKPSVCFVGTAFEGMRDYYVSSQRPTTPYEEFKSTISALGGFKKNIRDSELTDELASELWEKYELQKAVDAGYPISNLLYLEIRSGRFQSEAINCQATAFMPVNPLGIRSFIELGQSYNYLQRKNSDFLHAFIESMYPAISSFPINDKPKHAPIVFATEGIKVKELTQTENSQVVVEILQNRNDRLNLNGRLLKKGSRKFFEKPFSLEKGSVDISLRNNYYLGRASSNLELFVAINNGIIENVPIGLRSTPYHFHIEGLNTDDLIQAGIRATVDMGTAWIAYSIVDLLEWTESPETSESKLSIGSTKTLKNVEA